jgi:Rrf2 family iron-sulfur cluster assembly transcriptional regulator
VFSKTCEYALRAIITVAKNSIENRIINLREIANVLDSPEPFTAKIVQQLSKNKIIDSIKGPTGGYIIPMDRMKNTKIIEIVEIFDGKDVMTKCVLGLKHCGNTNPCAFHYQFAPIREQLSKELTNCTLFEVANGSKTL